MTDAGPVGFIGLGQIGAPMAARLVDWPGGLVVYDVRPEATEPLAAAGAVVAESAAAVGSVCGVVSVMVRDDDQVRDVVGQLVPAMSPGSVVAVHSTIRAETAEDLEADAASSGIEVLDVPVSGGFVGALQGSLAAIVGGEAAAFERAKPVFEHWATLVVHMGPVGAGTRTKLARNAMQFTGYTAAFEAQRLAEAAGLDLQKLGQIVRHSDAVTGGPGVIMVRTSTGDLESDDPLRELFSHTRDLGEKDLTLALELAASLGVSLPLAEQTLRDFAPGLGVPHDA